ncbi:hypothetical protein L6164_001210 [Bauhinia variegata]|uniref:Uncharacterized protein n=1 Tax=Bauhinia variegata TaxID=167791 RepID=A0ACB9QA80_BAUVA|nr:hypothetical protein L6164_001210 [Bauhinia variegata]
MSEAEILNIVQEMTMAITTYKVKGNNDQRIFEVLTTGFTGTLRGWWDNIISAPGKLIIQNAVKTEFTTYGQIGQTPDCTIQLLYTIVKHFIGDPIQDNLLS